MRTNSEHISPAIMLLIQWRALWAMAHLFAKSMTLAEYRDPRSAIEKAEMLDVWSRFAVVSLIGQIAALEARGAPRTKEDARAHEHLRAMVGALAALCLLAAKVKQDCIGRIKLVAESLSAERRSPQPILSPIAAPGFLDSS